MSTKALTTKAEFVAALEFTVSETLDTLRERVLAGVNGKDSERVTDEMVLEMMENGVDGRFRTANTCIILRELEGICDDHGIDFRRVIDLYTST